MVLHEFKDGYNPLRGKVAELPQSKYVIVKIGDRYAIRSREKNNNDLYCYYSGLLCSFFFLLDIERYCLFSFQ